MEQEKKEIWLGIGVVATLVALSLSMCGESDSEKKAKAEAFASMPFDQKLKSMSTRITDVNEVVKGEAVILTFYMPSILDGNDWARSFLDTATTVLSRFNEAAGDTKYKRVTFMAEVPTRDNLGNQGKQLGMKVTYDLAKLQGAKWENMTSFDVAELISDISFRPLGSDAVIEYCKDGDHIKYTPTFCKRAIASSSRQFNFKD